MSDDLDDLLRHAMKTLDAQVPSGYFDALPKRTLARLEGSMEPTGTGTTDRDHAGAGAPPIEEDSGLHDIRNLAQTTKQRISSRRISTNPIQTDDELSASSSAGWKAAVALPEPAKMISLPELDEPPAKHAKATAAADVPVVAIHKPFATAMQRKKSRAPLAIAGVMVAAAAGVAIYVATANKSTKSAETAAPSAGESTVAAATPARTPAAAGVTAPTVPATPTATPIEQAAPPAAAPAPAEDHGGESAGNAQQVALADDAANKAITTQVKTTSKPPPPGKKGYSKQAGIGAVSSGKVVATKDTGVKPVKGELDVKSIVGDKPDKTAGDKAGKLGDKSDKAKGKDDEPSFDELLKEANIDQKKKVEKPKLANKELTGDDFKHGMSAVSAKAQNCYKGAQGTAAFKLTVAPSGRVSKVTMIGQFAGKPEGDCIVKAVQGATFPPWDGGPQSFTYSYLLAE